MWLAKMAPPQRQTRQTRGDQRGDALLMRRVGEAVQKTNGDRLDAGAFDLAEDAFGIRLVERRHHAALRIHPLLDAPTPAPRHQRRRQVDIDVILLEAVLVADLDGVAEAVGGNEGGARTLALDQRIGRQCRAVNDDADIAGRQSRGLEDDGDRLHDTALGCARRRQHLGAEPTPVALERDIREGPADIDAETRFAAGLHAMSLWAGGWTIRMSNGTRA